jgi:hypothetical protein
VQGDSCALLDGVVEALHLLAIRDPARRRIILVIAERRDWSSKVQLPACALGGSTSEYGD